jgi:alpha-tubulin suppressor-like RCC1 family protein
MATTYTPLSGRQYSGNWNPSSQANAVALGTWPVTPGAPTIGTATVTSTTTVSVTFTAPAYLGIPASITGYVVTSSTGGFTSIGETSPIIVTGAFSLDQAYTFTAAATNASGTGPSSLASNSTLPNPSTQLWTWGFNNHGQLGLGNSGAGTNRSSPNQVGSLADWLNGAGGNYHTVVTKIDGTMWSWGNNDVGQLGLGTSGGANYKSSPTQIGALTNWITIASDNKSNAAIKTNGTLWSWGANTAGQLGQNNQANLSSPAQVGALTNWLNVTNGYNFTTAVKTDGTLWAWGLNTYGQLGISNVSSYSSPKQIGGNLWSRVASGFFHTVATRSDGTLWAWGRNSAGQLGVSNTTNYSSPKQVGNLTTWLYVAAGFYQTIAVKTDGTIWSWGSNSSGQLGLGNRTYYSSPKQIGVLTAWSTIACGNSYVLSSKTDGTLWSWGENNYGQLGLGNRTYYSSPKQVGSLATWVRVASGSNHAIVIKAP